MLKLLVGGWLRHALTVLGGIGIGAGYFDQNESAALVGAVMTIFGIAWSSWQKIKSKRK